MGWNDTTPKDKPTCPTPSLDIKTDTCLPLSEICSDGLDTDKQYALSNQGGTTVAVEIVPTDLTEVNDAITANAAAIAALVDKTLNTVYTGTTNDNPADGIVTLNFDIIDQDGNVESTYTIDVPDSTELPDVNTTYVFNPTPNGGFSAQPVDEAGNPIGVPFLLGSDDQTANEVSISDAGDYFVSSDVEGALQEIGADCADKEARIAALEGLNPVVDTEVITGSSDILVTYLDGTTETLDLPEFSGVADVDGNVTFDLNGTQFGPFDPAPDEDTNSTAVDNGDGTTTVTYADGSTYTYTQGLVVDTDTVVTYDFEWAADGSVTITGSDGSTFTGPPNTVDTDTDTFATLSGETITFANGDTLAIQSDTFAIARTVLGAQTDFNGDPIPAGSKVLELPNGDLVCLAEDRRTEWVCADPDMTFREVDAKSGNVITERTFSADFGRQFMTHATLAFQTTPDADYVTVGSTTLTNNSSCPKRVYVSEKSAISGQAINPTTGRLGMASRLLVNGSPDIPGTGVADSYTTNVDEQADNQYGANYFFTIQPGVTNIEWQKQITDVTNTNARHSNSQVIFIWTELVCC